MSPLKEICLFTLLLTTLRMTGRLPWVQPIRAYIQQASAEQVNAEMGPGAGDIAEIVAEIWGPLPDFDRPLTLKPQQRSY